MALRKNGKYSYGDNQDDLLLELTQYAKKNKYPIDEFEKKICPICGEEVFNLFSDDEESGALCQCVQCSGKQFIRDSQKYIKLDEIDYHECMCGNKDFKITVGLSFYKDTKDVRWIYVGGYCSKCGMVGNYIDWNER